jgi:hypothetical protein
MPSTVFNRLLEEQIEIFRNSFSSVSRATFYDEHTGKLIHAGEFGMYREAICREFLRFLIPGRLAISQGFLINSHDEVSAQCDIIVYDSESTPLIQSESRQRFFPVETVCAVGEVKSILSKSDLQEALHKLVDTKKIREQIGRRNPAIRRHQPSPSTPESVLRHQLITYDPENFLYDQLITFLICEKLDFNLDNLIMDELYEDDVLRRHRHNLVLSLKDGLLLYYYDVDGMALPWPVFQLGSTKVELKNYVIIPDKEWELAHFRLFATYIFMATSAATILFPEMTDYMGPTGGGRRLEVPDSRG